MAQSNKPQASEAATKAVEAGTAAPLTSHKVAAPKIGDKVQATLTSQFPIYHPKTRVKFFRDAPESVVYDGWIDAMVRAGCMTAVKE